MFNYDIVSLLTHIKIADRINAFYVCRIDMIREPINGTFKYAIQSTLNTVIQSNYYELFKYLYKSANIELIKKIVTYDRLNMLLYAIDHDVNYNVFDDRNHYILFNDGQLSIIKWLVKIGKLSCFDRIAARGNADIIYWLLMNNYLTENFILLCIVNHNFHIVDMVYRHKPIDVTQVILHAAKNNDLSVIKILYQYRPEDIKIMTFNTAAENNNLDTLIWLNEHKPHIIDQSTMYAAIRGGNVQVILYIYMSCPNINMTYAFNYIRNISKTDLLRILYQSHPYMLTTD